MLSAITTFLILYLPFVVLPFGTSYFEVPKVVISEIAIALLLFLSIIQNSKIFYFNGKLALLAGVIALVAVINLALSLSPLTFFGNAFRLQGTYLLLNLLIFALMSSKINLKLPPSISSIPIYLLLILTLLLGTNNTGRAIGPFGEPNSLAAGAIVLWIFAAFSKFKNSNFNKINIVLSFISVVIIVILSGSRSGLIALFLQMVFFTLTQTIKLSLGKAVILSVFLFMIALTFPFFDTNHVYENRAQIWQTALVAGWEHPIIGVGFGNIQTIMKEVGYQLKTNAQYAYVDSAHNVFLDFWVQSGILGLGAFLALLGLTFKNYIHKKDKRNLMLLIGLLTVMSFNPMSVAILVTFWWVIGQSFYSGETK